MSLTIYHLKLSGELFQRPIDRSKLDDSTIQALREALADWSKLELALPFTVKLNRQDQTTVLSFFDQARQFCLATLYAESHPEHLARIAEGMQETAAGYGLETTTGWTAQIKHYPCVLIIVTYPAGESLIDEAFTFIDHAAVAYFESDDKTEQDDATPDRA